MSIGRARSFRWRRRRQRTSTGTSVLCEKYDLIAIPDLTVTCGKPQDDGRSLTNPKVIVEVLSKSAMDRDLGLKFRASRTLDALEEYVTISQWAPEFTMHRRTGPRTWEVEDFEGLENTINFQSLNLAIPFASVWDVAALTGEPA